MPISAGTVYRVLLQFEQAGLLVRSHFESGKSVFELNEAAPRPPGVPDLRPRSEEFFDTEIERRQRAVAAERGFESRSTRCRCTPLRKAHCARTGRAPAPRWRIGSVGLPDRRAALRRQPSPSVFVVAVAPAPLVALDEFLVGVDPAQL